MGVAESLWLCPFTPQSALYILTTSLPTVHLFIGNRRSWTSAYDILIEPSIASASLHLCPTSTNLRIFTASQNTPNTYHLTANRYQQVQRTTLSSSESSLPHITRFTSTLQKPHGAIRQQLHSQTTRSTEAPLPLPTKLGSLLAPASTDIESVTGNQSHFWIGYLSLISMGVLL